MPFPGVARLRDQFLAMLAVGTSLWLFRVLAYEAVGLIPAFADTAREWRSTVAFDMPALLELGLAILFTAFLLLIHRFEHTSSTRRAVGVGLLVALIPMVAVANEAARAGLPELAMVRVVITGAGVVGASVLVFWFPRRQQHGETGDPTQA